MRVLVTGATGLIGRQIAKDAFPRGTEVIFASRTPTGRDGDHHAADLSNSDEAEALIRFTKPTHVIHAAWETRPPTYWEDAANLAWVQATARMAAEFAHSGGQRFVQVGSCAEYEWSGGLCTEGVSPDGPRTLYGKSKLAAYAAVEAAARTYFEAVEARIFTVYGAGEHKERFVPSICLSHLTGKVPELGSGTQIRDFLHSSDVARALVVLTCSSEAQGVINVGSGIGTPLSTIAEMLAQLAGAAETGLGRKPDRPGEPSILVASPKKLRGTGWTPAVSLRDGLERTLEWWRGQVEKEIG